MVSESAHDIKDNILQNPKHIIFITFKKTLINILIPFQVREDTKNLETERLYHIFLIVRIQNPAERYIFTLRRKL